MKNFQKKNKFVKPQKGRFARCFGIKLQRREGLIHQFVVGCIFLRSPTAWQLKCFSRNFFQDEGIALDGKC